MRIKTLTSFVLGVFVSSTSALDYIPPQHGASFYMEMTPDSTYPNLCSTQAWYGSKRETVNLALDTTQFNIGIYTDACANCQGVKNFTMKMAEESTFYQFVQKDKSEPNAPMFVQNSGQYGMVGFSGDFISDTMYLTYFDWNRMTITPQTILAINQASTPYKNTFNGYIGLAPYI